MCVYLIQKIKKKLKAGDSFKRMNKMLFVCINHPILLLCCYDEESFKRNLKKKFQNDQNYWTAAINFSHHFI